MLSKEQRIILSIVLGALSIVGFVCLYGFTIGGEYISVKYVLYCLFISFVMTNLAFMFIYKKKVIKSFYKEELFLIVIAVVVVLQMLLYQPLNLLTTNDKGEEYEVVITDCDRYYQVYFTDKDEITREKNASLKYMLSFNDNELSPEKGGRMIVKETTGGFNCKHFTIIKVTYVPEEHIS